MTAKLRRWWYVWKCWRVWPWQYEADLHAVRERSDILRGRTLTAEEKTQLKAEWEARFGLSEKWKARQ